MHKEIELDVDPLEAVLLSVLSYMPLHKVQFAQHEAGKDPSQFSGAHATALGDESARKAARAAAARRDEVESFRKRIPQGWRVAAQMSAYGGTPEKPDRNNQIVVFANDETRQYAIVFKGSNNLQNYISDILNDGASEWKRVRENVGKILEKLDRLDVEAKRTNPDYVPYVRFVAGHSLGGGLAQICAILYGMSGLVLNPLPIPRRIIQSEMGKGGAGLDKVAAWVAANTLTLIHVKHDIAHRWYHDFKRGYFVNTHILALPHYVVPSPGQSVASDVGTLHEATPLSVVTDAPQIRKSFVRHALYGLRKRLPRNRLARAVDAHLGLTAVNVILQLKERNKLPRVLLRPSTFLIKLSLPQLDLPTRRASQPQRPEQPDRARNSQQPPQRADSRSRGSGGPSQGSPLSHRNSIGHNH